jgi:hypothetical protein
MSCVDQWYVFSLFAAIPMAVVIPLSMWLIYGMGKRDAYAAMGAAVPELTTIALLGLGLAGLGFSRRRQAN